MCIRDSHTAAQIASQEDGKALMLEADPRLKQAIQQFNNGAWYDAHDLFEELWHETADPERRSLQGILQVAVAQLHLQRGNRRGATILFGEALGRLKRPGTPDLGLDLASLCRAAQQRLEALHQDGDPESCTVPVLQYKR